MTTLREELHQPLEVFPEDELAQVPDFLEVLLAEPEELTEEEWEEVRETVTIGGLTRIPRGGLISAPKS